MKTGNYSFTYFSFIYLNSVKGLSALTDKYPRTSLKRIVSRYKDQNYSLDYRLRIGEVLMQTIQRSGSTFAKYGIIHRLFNSKVHLFWNLF